jgi:fumarate hydratase subunit beta
MEMSEAIRLQTPLQERDLTALQIGDAVLISGIIYTARDAAHKRLVELLKTGQDLPFDLRGQIVYYVGPTPERPGQVIGSAGPTTSGRMDSYTPLLLEAGMKGIIGKGQRRPVVIESLVKNKAVYFAATGGAGVLLAQTVKASRIVAYEELGAEAIRELVVEDFPAIVAIDTQGHDLYQEGVKRYRQEEPTR